MLLEERGFRHQPRAEAERDARPRRVCLRRRSRTKRTVGLDMFPYSVSTPREAASASRGSSSDSSTAETIFGPPG